MRATNFEFRFRFWFITLIFWLAFGCYTLDHLNAAVALVRLVFRGDPNLKSAGARHAIRAVFGLSAALVAAAAWVRTWGSAYLRTEVVRDSAVRTEKLVADGPYRRLRNPLYLGNLLMAAGIGLFASRSGWLVLYAAQ